MMKEAATGQLRSELYYRGLTIKVRKHKMKVVADTFIFAWKARPNKCLEGMGFSINDCIKDAYKSIDQYFLGINTALKYTWEEQNGIN